MSASPLTRTRILVIERDSRRRTTLTTLLGHAPDLEVVGSFEDVSDALARRTRRPPGVVLLDVDPGETDVAGSVRTLKRSPFRPAVVAWASLADAATVFTALGAGADGYLLKDTGAGPLLAAVRCVSAGGAPLSPEVARVVVERLRQPEPEEAGPRSERPRRICLSRREHQVLRGLSEGRSYKQVADRLEISVDTVRAHVRGLYSKLGVHSVSQALGVAFREQLL